MKHLALATLLLLTTPAFALPNDAASLREPGSIVSINCRDWSNLDETALPSWLFPGGKLTLEEMQRMAGGTISEDLDAGSLNRTMQVKTPSCEGGEASVTVQFGW